MTCRSELPVEGPVGTKFHFGKNYDPEPQFSGLKLNQGFC